MNKLSKCEKCEAENEYILKINSSQGDSLCLKCTINLINPFEENDIIYCNLKISPTKNSFPSVTKTFEIENSNLLKMKNQTNRSLFIYCLEENKIVTTLDKYNWPFNIFLNGSKIIYNNSENKNYIDITMLVSNNNTLNISYFQPISNSIHIVILSRKIIRIKEINLGYSWSIWECKERLINTMKDQLISKEKFSISCVYTNKKMDRPVKGVNCKHFQCFEYITYLKINKFRKKFRCPICRIYCFVSDLFEDEYFKLISEEVLESGIDLDMYDLFMTDEGKWINIARIVN